MSRPAPDHTVVHLVRHGEVHNPEGILYGRLSGYRLSPAGEEMAMLAAKALAGHDVRVVRSSPLERARQTAEPIAEQFGLEVETDDRLIESGNVFEGMRFGVGDGALRRPAVWRHLYNPFRPACGACRRRAPMWRAHAASSQWRRRRAVQSCPPPRSPAVSVTDARLRG